MSHINEKLGLKAAGARRRLNCLSGVGCHVCPHHYVVSHVIQKRLRWTCGFCGSGWTPTAIEIQAYNRRVRARDQVAA